MFKVPSLLFLVRVWCLTTKGFIKKNTKSRPPRHLAIGIAEPYSDCCICSFFCLLYKLQNVVQTGFQTISLDYHNHPSSLVSWVLLPPFFMRKQWSDDLTTIQHLTVYWVCLIFPHTMETSQGP